MNSADNVGRRRSVVLGLAILAAAAFAAAPRLNAEDASATRAVRLSSVDGQVQLSQGTQVIADSAVANTPLFEGTQVVTFDEGRAEIQFEDGSVVRLSPNSSLTLSVLRQQGGTAETVISMESGLVYFELQGNAQAGRTQVRFGGSTVTAGGFTVLRVNLDNPPGELAVFSGNAHLEGGSTLTLDLHGGESVALNSADPARYKLAESIEPDSWDSWNADRDQALTADAAAKTGAANSLLNNNNPAWNELDANGNWYNVPGQGYVWSPYEASTAGWDPWGNGYWMWTPRFGYIWISGYPWGYMPFECGMWSFYTGFGWGWAPGADSCLPWWNNDYWVPNVGYTPPRFYFPQPPRPRKPIGRLPIRGGGKHGPYPLVPVNRRPPGGKPGLPVRDRNAPVVIAGHVVQPLRPLSPHPHPDRPVIGPVNRPLPGYPGARMPGSPPRTAGPVYGGSRPGTTPAPRSSGGQHVSAPSHGSSGGSSGSHSSGGGGSSSHSSGGGGSSMGGGGGGSHGGGGGGGSSSGSSPHH